MLRERPASYRVIRTLVEILGSWIDGAQSLHERKHSVELLSQTSHCARKLRRRMSKRKAVERRLNQCYLQLYFFSPIAELIFVFPP